MAGLDAAARIVALALSDKKFGGKPSAFKTTRLGSPDEYSSRLYLRRVADLTLIA